MMGFPQGTSPPAVYQASIEDLTFEVDCSANVPTTDTLTVVSVTLVSPTGATVALADDPSVSGSVIYQRIRSGVLTGNPQPYQLVCLYQAQGQTNVFATVLLVFCPQGVPNV